MEVEVVCKSHNLAAQKFCTSLSACNNRLLCSECETNHPHRRESKNLTDLKDRKVLSDIESTINRLNYKLTQAKGTTESEIDQLFDKLIATITSQLISVRTKIKEKYSLNIKRADEFITKAKNSKQNLENTLDRVCLEGFSDETWLTKLAEDIYELEANILPNQEPVMKNVFFDPNLEHLKQWQTFHEKLLSNTLWETLIDKKPPQENYLPQPLPKKSDLTPSDAIKKNRAGKAVHNLEEEVSMEDHNHREKPGRKRVKMDADSENETVDTPAEKAFSRMSPASLKDENLPPIKFAKNRLPDFTYRSENFGNTCHTHTFFGALTYIPTKNWLATAGKEGQIQIRDFDALDEVVAELKSDMGFIFQLMFAETNAGGYLIASGYKKDIWICNIDKDFEICLISKAHENTIYAIEHLTGRNQFASASHDGQLKIWNFDGFKNDVVYKLPGQIPIGSIKYLAPFDKIVVGRFDGSMLVIGQDRIEKKIAAHYDNDFIHALYFDEKYNYLYSGSEDGTIKLWNCRTGIPEFMRVFDLNAKRKTSVKALVGLTERDILIETRGTDMIRIWRISTGEVVKEVENYIEKKKKAEPLIYVPSKECLVTAWQKKVCKIVLP